MVLARPARCSNRVGEQLGHGEFYGAKVCGGRRTIYKTCTKDGPEVADENNRPHQIERERVCYGMVVSM